MNLREIWKGDTILDVGGNRSARRKPARARMDREPNSYTGCPRMFYTQKCKILRISTTIKTVEFGVLIYLSDMAVLLASGEF